MEEDDGKHTRVWWLYAARYAVATVVTMLTAAVITGAIVEFQRPEKLNLLVANGYVTVGKIKTMSPPPGNVVLSFAFMAINPSGRGSIKCKDANVTIRYYNDSVIAAYTLSLLVGPQMRQTSYQKLTFSTPSEVPMEFVQTMHDGVEINNAKVDLSGMFETQISSLYYKRDRRITNYNCTQLTISTWPQSNPNDVICSEGLG